jgi:GT2 family glycosyltransferase
VIEQQRGEIAVKEVALQAADRELDILRGKLARSGEELWRAEEAIKADTAQIRQLREELSLATYRRATPDVLRENLVVCMLFFNKLEQTIQSAESFVGAGLSIHLLNNGSAPEASSNLRAHFLGNPLVTIADAGSNRGVSGGRNLQIKQTTQPWLLFVDNDISLEKANLVTELAAAIGSRPNTEIFVPRLFNKHEGSWGPFSDFAIDERGNCAFVQSETPFSNSFPGGASIISRGVFDRLGVYDEELFVGFEDFELAIRAWKQGQPLLVSRLDSVNLIHDHRVSNAEIDKTSSRVRYDVKSITHSHSVIERKHGIRLDPNFAEWLKEQVRQLTGEEVAGVPTTPVEQHILQGAIVTPRWCGAGRLVVLVDGEGDDCWLRLRAAQTAADAGGQAGLEVIIVLLGGDNHIVQRAIERGLIHRAASASSLGQADLVELRRSALGVCWYLRGLMLPEFLAKSAQMLKHDRSVRQAFIHPERVVLATSAGQGFQYIRTGWFDPLEEEHDVRLYPVFVVPGTDQEPVARKVAQSFADQAMALIAQQSGRPDRHFGLSGSAVVVKV